MLAPVLKKKKKVLVLMSGGVDSSTAAFILKSRGFDVTGATMVLFGNNNNLGEDSNAKDAKMVADFLGVRHVTLDLRTKFKSKVIDYFSQEYISGRTPNPCVMCNKHIKFGEMLGFAKRNGFDFLASGHYAKIFFDENLKEWLIKKAPTNKDQSYVLYNLKQEDLKYILLPLHNFEKSDVRKIAKEQGLPVAEKPESQEICFIKGCNYSEFIKNKYNFEQKNGYFVDSKGNILGKHAGIINYTIGQRRGLGVSFGRPVFVLDINSEKNTVTLGEEKELFSRGLFAKYVNIISKKLLPIGEEKYAYVKIRYKAKETLAKIFVFEDEKNLKAKITFKESLKSVTKGQSVVFYKDDILLGGGIIESRF